MAGVTIARIDDATRWAKADRLADGIVEADWLKQRRRLWIKVITVSVVVGGGIGLILSLLRAGTHPSQHHHHHVPLWRAITGLVVVVLGLGIEIRTLWKMRASGELARNRNSPLVPLRLRSRMLIVREIKGRTPLQPGHLKIARSGAQRLTRQRDVPGLTAGVVIMWAGLVLQGGGLVRVVYLAVLIVTSPLVFIATRRNAAAAANFLQQHPSEAQAWSAP